MTDRGPLWILCPCCRCFWCTRHQKHAHDCQCPPLEDLGFDPYSSSGPEEEEEEAVRSGS